MQNNTTCACRIYIYITWQRQHKHILLFQHQSGGLPHLLVYSNDFLPGTYGISWFPISLSTCEALDWNWASLCSQEAQIQATLGTGYSRSHDSGEDAWCGDHGNLWIIPWCLWNCLWWIKCWIFRDNKRNTWDEIGFTVYTLYHDAYLIYI